MIKNEKADGRNVLCVYDDKGIRTKVFTHEEIEGALSLMTQAYRRRWTVVLAAGVIGGAIGGAIGAACGAIL